jgi:hypothetical protein
LRKFFVAAGHWLVYKSIAKSPNEVSRITAICVTFQKISTLWDITPPLAPQTLCSSSVVKTYEIIFHEEKKERIYVFLKFFLS